MIVTTISQDCLNTLSLPQKVSGRYWIRTGSLPGSENMISVEGINGEWIMKSNRHVHIADSDGKLLKSAPVDPSRVYELRSDKNGCSFVFAEPITHDRQVFRKYLARSDMDLTIGRAPQSDICFSNKTVSSRHAVLSSRNGQWFLEDMNSVNGTFVNARRIHTASLAFGDVIFIMGLKIVVGKYFIALNDPDGKVRVAEKLRPFVSQPVKTVGEDDEPYELPETEYFYRAPRFKRDVETAVFKIDPPPSSPISEEMPWPLVMGSSMAMGMMSIVTLSSAIASSNYVSMAMGGSMLASTLLLPTITRSYEKKQSHRKEEQRQKKYREYLDRISVRISEARQLQEEILRENHAPIQDCERRILDVRHDLWERGPGQDDFLTVRLGTGSGVLDAQFSYSERTFTLDDDNLQDELHALCERPNPLHNIPITYSLSEDHVSGVIGSRKQVLDFAKGIIIQLAALYSYDEVKFVFLLDPAEEEMQFVKWLPHVWSDDKKFRFIMTNVNETKEVSAYLEKVIAARLGMSDSDASNTTPHYIIFSLNKTLAVRAEMLKQILSANKYLHMSVVAFYDALNSLPKECSMVAELGPQGGSLFDKNSINGKVVEFTPDISLTVDPLKLSVRLANIPLDTQEANFKLPDLITFLEMFGVGQVEHLNALTRWKENDPTKSLEAPVGIDTLGDTFKLDLHEKFHGPHGLVAGMTGSGKSEFIIAYILSMAVNYHPNEVAFILIDYKGGGMAKTFENLPHTAGIITNLDGSAIKRSLVSIESELKRRQAIFAEASKRIGMSNIDIYRYQKLYREGSVTEPLQHLFIIADEFAELKTQQPDFMTQLISAARIGRSLGVHLILATQKPSGVVDDQIWSNSKFRICLKVQERADSMDMLKREDAAELTNTGRFYLQVGYNELFEMGQSAWAGAPYYPSDKVPKDRDDSIVVIDTNGHPVREMKPARKHAPSEDAKKQVDAITEYLRRIADEEDIHIRPLWLEPIPGTILLDDVRRKYAVKAEPFKLAPLIGEFDDPSRQRQCALTLPLSEDGNAIIYGAAGSGKELFLQTMLCSLLQEHTPKEVNIYVLDFGAETLRVFAGAPHVGDVIVSYEAEKIANLFKMLQDELERRKKLFTDYGGDFSSYVHFSGSTVPAITIVINNFAAFSELYDEWEDIVSHLTREGSKYGVYFVLTAAGTSDVRFRLMQNFKTMLALQLNDPVDYSVVIGKTDGLYPAKFEGRGLVRLDQLYEFQVAKPTDEDVSLNYIKQFCAGLRENWKGDMAAPVPVLPEVVDIRLLRPYTDSCERLGVPIGVEKNSLSIHRYPFCASYITTVMSAGRESQSFIADLAALLGTAVGWQGVVFDLPRAIGGDIGTLHLCNTRKGCESEVSALWEMLVYRNNTYKDALEQNLTPENFERHVIIINSISSLQSALSEEGNEMLSLLLERGSADYNMTVIVADQVSVFSGLSYEKWFKNQLSTTDGIWIGSGISDQYLLKASRTTPDMRGSVPDGFGFVLRSGECITLKLLSEITEGESYA